MKIQVSAFVLLSIFLSEFYCEQVKDENLELKAVHDNEPEAVHENKEIANHKENEKAEGIIENRNNLDSPVLSSINDSELLEEYEKIDEIENENNLNTQLLSEINDPELPENAFAVKHKRCPMYRLGSPVVGGSRNGVPDLNNKKNQLYKSFCKTCLFKNKCQNIGDCPLCSKWCTANLCTEGPDVSTRGKLDGEEKPSPDDDQRKKDETVALSSRGNFVDNEESNVYSITLPRGNLMDIMLSLLGVYDSKGVKSMTISVKSIGDKPIKLRNLEENSAKGEKGNALIKKVAEIKNSLSDKLIKAANGKGLNTNILDRLVSEILSKVRSTDTDHSSGPRSSKSGRTNLLSRFKEPHPNGHLIRQSRVNPDIIEGSPDVSQVRDPLVRTNPDLLATPEETQNNKEISQKGSSGPHKLREEDDEKEEEEIMDEEEEEESNESTEVGAVHGASESQHKITNFNSEPKDNDVIHNQHPQFMNNHNEQPLPTDAARVSLPHKHFPPHHHFPHVPPKPHFPRPSHFPPSSRSNVPEETQFNRFDPIEQPVGRPLFNPINQLNSRYAHQYNNFLGQPQAQGFNYPENQLNSRTATKQFGQDNIEPSNQLNSRFDNLVGQPNNNGHNQLTPTFNSQQFNPDGTPLNFKFVPQQSPNAFRQRFGPDNGQLGSMFASQPVGQALNSDRDQTNFKFTPQGANSQKDAMFEPQSQGQLSSRSGRIGSIYGPPAVGQALNNEKDQMNEKLAAQQFNDQQNAMFVPQSQGQLSSRSSVQEPNNVVGEALIPPNHRPFDPIHGDPFFDHRDFRPHGHWSPDRFPHESFNPHHQSFNPHHQSFNPHHQSFNPHHESFTPHHNPGHFFNGFDRRQNVVGQPFDANSQTGGVSNGQNIVGESYDPNRKDLDDQSRSKNIVQDDNNNRPAVTSNQKDVKLEPKENSVGETNADSKKAILGARASDLIKRLKNKQDETMERITKQKQQLEKARANLFGADKDSLRLGSISNAPQGSQKSPEKIELDMAESVQNDPMTIGNRNNQEVIGSQPLESSFERMQPDFSRVRHPYINQRLGDVRETFPEEEPLEALNPDSSFSKDNQKLGLSPGQIDSEPVASNSLGSIVPAGNDADISFKTPSDIYFIGNGIKLPLQMVKKNDGAVHFSVDVDKLCSCKNSSCPKNHNAEDLEKTVGTILEKEAELKEELEDIDEEAVGMAAPNSNKERRNGFLNMKNNIATKYGYNNGFYLKRSVADDDNQNVLESQQEEIINGKENSDNNERNEKRKLTKFFKDVFNQSIKNLKNAISDKSPRAASNTDDSDDNVEKPNLFDSKTYEDNDENVIRVSKLFKFKGLEDQLEKKMENIEKSVDNYSKIDDKIFEDESEVLKDFTENPKIQKEIGLVSNVLGFLKKMAVESSRYKEA